MVAGPVERDESHHQHQCLLLPKRDLMRETEAESRSAGWEKVEDLVLGVWESRRDQYGG